MTRRSATVSGVRKRRRSKVAKASKKKERRKSTPIANLRTQMSAASRVLELIGRSPSDLTPVFEAIAENARELTGALYSGLARLEDGIVMVEALRGWEDEALAAIKRSYPRPARRDNLLAAAIIDGEVQNVADILVSDADYTSELQTISGYRSMLIVPMMREQKPIGAIGVFSRQIGVFQQSHVDLLKTFAAQAVIAIENARLLKELRQRTADLSDALERQTATSEVLQVITGSPGNLQPVFAAMLEKAVRICDASFGNIYRRDGEVLHIIASQNTPTALAEFRKRVPLPSTSNSITERVLINKTTIQVADIADESGYREFREQNYVAAVELGGVRTLMMVPLIKGDEPVGLFTLFRQHVRPFTDEQIALVENFASQAVVAIENARLLNELRERTAEVEKLNRHLEQRVADQVGEIERMGRLRRFLPPQVADLILASGSEDQLKSHRREITALFCDLRGFTGFTETADAEDVMALLRGYHASIGQIVIKYNGTLERYAGDGVMVIFNDPVPVENPALQAVLMALEVRDAIGSLTETWQRWGHDIGFGIGIAHGFATLGTIGFEGRFDYAAIGTVSNVASRLCDEAKPGQILISPRVLTKVEDVVKVEPVGEFELKGIRRPMAAYNVLSAIA